jgi:hypothetical protein
VEEVLLDWVHHEGFVVVCHCYLDMVAVHAAHRQELRLAAGMDEVARTLDVVVKAG